MKYIARWKFPAMHGDKIFDCSPYQTRPEAELDAMDVRYEGIYSWVDVITDPGEVPPSTPITETTASDYCASGWWKTLPAHVVALAQAKQPVLCMPLDEFQAACKTVLGTTPTVSGAALVNLLRQHT
jgi:hypothetical protein